MPFTLAGRRRQRPSHRSLCVIRAMLGVGGRRGTERRAENQPFALFHVVTLSMPLRSLCEDKALAREAISSCRARGSMPS
jgi:hypothetical protein